ncbi:hypothetical protein CCC_04034 [Paramagnetospirillum magnetotacticum MS-1]|uniref:Hemerythrin-like domain-containing protein n=1 Tax=Paramagnetospirillum magnetotacticum MS-1 TaxID=272627 RepID=A0A0C2YWL7_PARME|nr:hemerythrin family protein [Paramagnetospirillum magnetotacticum]KIL99518.1 hypothetical protein CCC_04034 [Paramagnetospirillum magnetotacticum MS-1]
MGRNQWRATIARVEAELSAEHDEMAVMLSSLRCYFAAAEVGDEAIRILRRLSDYSRGHFAREEALMDLCPSYSEASVHRQAHEQFLTRVERLMEIRDLSGELSADMPHMIEQWWRGHVDVVDRILMEQLQQQFSVDPQSLCVSG